MSSSSTREELWNVDYVDEDHVLAFAQALSLSDQPSTEGDVSPSSPKSPKSPSLPDPFDKPQPPTWKYGPSSGTASHGDTNGHLGVDSATAAQKQRIDRLTATSDFAPIHQRVSRRRHPVASSQGWTYHIIRWPLLGWFALIIYLEFGAYVAVRQIVNLFEYLVAWRGDKAKLRQELRKAKTYEEWVETAKKLDAHLGFDDWKDEEEDGYFDWTLVKRVKRQLARERANKDTRGLMNDLSTTVRPNFAATGNPKMYSETFYGTKSLVESHVKEVLADLEFVRTATDVTLEEKRKFFRQLNRNFGSSALCLSGGASFGYYHFGVVKAFLEADLLPRVITGTSAGGLVAALVCTRTDSELKELLKPELADKITACSDPFTTWVRRWWRTGARFSTIEWARKSMFFTRGSLTFREAYERTGRILNVSVVPSDRHSPTILLNYITAPNCVIWSAILASAAVPGILNPVVLMAKGSDGQLYPHNLGGSRFKDGSLREDIPIGGLHSQFNCNFSIVSQTNPHVHLFFFSPRGSVGRPVAHRKGKGWRGGFILSAMESYIKLDMNKHFKVIRDLDLLPQILQSDWSGVFTQRFSGTLTLTPRSTLGDWFRILSDPNRPQLARMIEVGERVAWPALRMVRNRMLIERAIARGRAEVRLDLQRQRTTNDVGSPQRNNIRPVDDLVPSLQLPLESDNDTDIAHLNERFRRSESPRHSALAFEQKGSSARRRKPFPQSHSRKGSQAEAITAYSNSLPASTARYAATLSQTLRHARDSFSSPFRSTRPVPTRQESTPSSGLTRSGRERRRSQVSFSRWLGANASDSSSSDEDPWAKMPANNDSGLSEEEGVHGPVYGGSAIADEPDGVDSADDGPIRVEPASVGKVEESDGIGTPVRQNGGSSSPESA